MSAWRPPTPNLSVGDIAERIVCGGWPGLLGLTPPQAIRAVERYLEDICRVDVQRLDGVRRDPAGVRSLIASLARNTACPVTIEALATDAGGAERPMKTETVRGYLAALERLMVTDDVPPWRPSLRSRTRLRGQVVRHLADPSLATAALNAGPDALLRDLNLMGLLFESLVVRDLRVDAEALSGRVYHYRDSLGLEADVIIELRSGGWAAFEVKLGSSPVVVEGAAADLLRLRDRVGMDAGHGDASPRTYGDDAIRAATGEEQNMRAVCGRGERSRADSLRVMVRVTVRENPGRSAIVA